MANDYWKNSWEERRSEIDNWITQGLGAGRSVEDTFSEVSGQTRGWVNDEAASEADYASEFREYYDSRLADLERGGALARQENGSFYVNPEYRSGEAPGNSGTAENRLAEAAVSSRTSSGSKDPAEQ
jgi:hypothetical protein